MTDDDVDNQGCVQESIPVTLSESSVEAMQRLGLLSD